MLSSSDKSAKTLSRRLREKGFSESAAAHSLRLLTEKGYLNEDESCRSYAISAVRSKHYGRRRIVEYLVSHGYPTDAAKHAADGIPDEDYRDALVYNIEKKCPDLAELPRAEQQKKIAALVRLGFTPGEIFDAIRKHK